MTLEKSIRRLIELHHKAEQKDCIRNKVAWALYQVWKESEEDERRKAAKNESVKKEAR